MRSLFLAMLFAAASAPSAAQIQRPASAFEPAITPLVGITSFGKRHSFAGAEAAYRSSVTVGVRGELPLTRRIGVLGTLAVTPLAKQRVENPVSTSLYERVTIIRADAALGWRFIPRAPVFFLAGGGVMRATLPAYPDFDEAVTEPRALFGLGYDHSASGRWNFRVSATGYVTKPQDPDPDSWTRGGPADAVNTKSTVFDWGIEFGGRYRFRRGS